MALFLVIDPEPMRRRLLKALVGAGYEILESKDLQEANRVALGRDLTGVFMAWPVADARTGRQPEKLTFTAQHLLPMVQSQTDAGSAADWAAKMLPPSVTLTPVNMPEGKLTYGEIARDLNRVMSRPITPAPEFVGSSKTMVQLLEQAAKVAANDSPVLLVGEPGTGKRTLCSWIHHVSSRGQRGGPFEEFQGAGLEPNEAYAELFGSGKGAFPWAFQARPGLMEAADGGTLYIHEATEIGRPLQAKLLRALQRPVMSIERLGETDSRIVNVRITVGSRTSLRQKAGADFSEELFYALSRNCLELPPLRTRTEDIPEIAHFMLRERILRPEMDLLEPTVPTQKAEVPEETMEVLRRYPWPGNLDELEAALSEAVLRSEGKILKKHLPEYILQAVARIG